jgi:hypothetical protein
MSEKDGHLYTTCPLVHLALRLAADQPANHVLLAVAALLSCQCLHVTFLLDVCPTWARGVALVDLQR